MKKKLVVMLVLSTMIFCFAGCGKEEASESQSSGQEQDAETDNSEDAGDETEGVSETADPEAEKNEDALEEEISYISCTADEMMQECVSDLDAAKAKYLNQYVEITGVLDAIELDEDADPVGRVVRMDTSVEVTNASCKITGITWEEENVPLESFQEAMEKMQPGDTVTMRVYVDSLDDSFYDYYFDLYGVEIQS